MEHLYLGLGLAGILTTALVIALWQAAGRLPRMRLLARAVLLLAVLPLLATVTFMTAAPASTGTWRCTICCAETEGLLYLDIPLFHGPPRPIDADAQSFESWYRQAPDGEHDHDWMPVGCHRVGIATIACSRDPASDYVASLPALPDQELARWLAARVRSAAPAQRRRMLRSFHEAPARAADATGAIALDPRWLERHPEWR